MNWRLISAGAALGAVALVSIAASEAPTPAPVQPNVPPPTPTGYLPAGTAPDSLLFVPAPPAAGSAALARDEEASKAGLAMRDTPRWEQAKLDAVFSTPGATGAFSCAANLPISPETTPKLTALLRKAMPDIGLATRPTKKKYMRARPFMNNGQPSCTPDDEAGLRQDGSYPSGHSALGYGWGLILAEVIPDRAAQLVARGRAFGDSRRICNVHYLSDIEEGRIVASAVIARLHADPVFRADLQAASEEVKALRLSKPAAPDCARENAALGSG